MDIINISDRKKILLADDSATIRKVIELTFADEGIDVYSVADGDAAMKKFVEVEPDLVLADVNMPGMSGYQICEMIKQDESTCAIPVILLTGSFEPFDLAEASRVGCNSYFTKPFTSIRELVSRVKEYLELGAFDNPGPESVDIDDLYHKSLADGANSVAETGSEALSVEIAEPVNLDEEHEIDELAKLHAQLVNFDPDEVRTIPESLAGDNAIEVGSTDVEEIEISDLTDLDADQKEDPEIHKTVPQTSIHDTDPLAMAEMGMPETEPEVRSEESVIQLVEQAETATDLGDAGMDDEMIDAVQITPPAISESEPEDEPPSSVDVITKPGVIDPFETPAEEFESSQAAGFESPGSDESAANTERVFPVGATAVKFAIDDDPHAGEAANGDASEDPVDGSGVDGSEISDALIEKIAERVVAKLSDAVVREVALDAVPKIAEKLIREALEGNQRK